MRREWSVGPLLAKTVGPTQQPSVQKSRESGTVAGITPATVLVADDDADTRCAITGVLIAEGYDVVEAADGARVLEILARASDERTPLPSVVLLDFLMPGFSGLGILRLMQRFPRPPSTVIMTGFPDPSVEVIAHRLGARGVLRKPIDESDLCAIVRESVASSEGVDAGTVGESA